jgi:hypothetical protein
MVRAERFELPTFWFVARRSIQLSYARMRTRIDYQTGRKTPSSAASHQATAFAIVRQAMVDTDMVGMGPGKRNLQVVVPKRSKTA